jgi:hypothetical protein
MDRCKNPSNLSSSDAGSENRAERLLAMCSELEQYETKMAPDDFADWIESAALACGFLSVYEACECLLGSELFRLHLKVMHAVAAEKRLEHVDGNPNGEFFERSPRRQRTRYC